MPNERKVCPECGHVFQGNGWDGIDAHWRAKHEGINGDSVPSHQGTTPPT